MRWLFALLILAHGLVHLAGVAKAFGLVQLPGLSQPISRPMGLLWLLAGVGFMSAGLALATAPRVWWWLAAGSLILSQIAILDVWSDAKWGTVVNLVIVAGVVYGAAAHGPFGLRHEYETEIQRRERPAASQAVVSEEDLAALPEPVRRYLRRAGAVGRPRVRWFRARWQGRIRSGPDDPWMSFVAEQENFLDEPARFFFMRARRSGLPVDVFHEYSDRAATMRARLLSLLTVVEAEGDDMTRAETVTLLNDMSLLAPSSLLDSRIQWSSLDDTTARARFTVGARTVQATLHFDEEGRLVNFVSDDRLAASADGGSFTPRRWSTPVGQYRRFGPWRIMSRGEGRWHPESGVYVYFEGELLELETGTPGRRER